MNLKKLGHAQLTNRTYFYGIILLSILVYIKHWNGNMMAGKWELAITTNVQSEQLFSHLTKICIKKDGFSAIKHKIQKTNEAYQLLKCNSDTFSSGKTSQLAVELI